jgi:1-acyl-sn-glycerol-3-phosphate acyltransferase
MTFFRGVGKTGLVAKPIMKARTRQELAPSHISASVVWAGRLLIPAYLRIVLFFRKIEIRNPELILEAVRDFQEKRARLIVAFRHPYGDEPQLIFHVFENLIPRYARGRKTPLKHRPNLRLVHDYAVPLWGGAFIRFLLPRAGAIPVYHVKFEPKSLKNIRSVLRDGPSPLGIAPEGQISYHSETLPRIEQGTIRMGFWCASDIKKAARSERVLVLPLSVHYQYDIRDRKKIMAALERTEVLCGIGSAPDRRSAFTLESLPPRIEAVERRILDIVENYYAHLHGYRAQDLSTSNGSESARRQCRWNALLPVALDMAERMLGLDPIEDDVVRRMYRIRLEGWARIYPENPVEDLSALEAGLAHRRAGEAWLAMRHMETVDLMSYHDVEYLMGGESSGPSFNRVAESVINRRTLLTDCWAATSPAVRMSSEKKRFSCPPLAWILWKGWKPTALTPSKPSVTPPRSSPGDSKSA